MTTARPRISTRPASRATIAIRNLRLRTFIGFNPEETEKRQDVVINIEIDYAVAESALRDRVEDALDYKVITKQVIRHVEEGRFLLLERLVADVLEICSDHPSICSARVTIEKPHALRFADSVSLTLEYRADPARNLTLLEKAS
jgi:D-erythro-7,8-dihydroneopterin triphosphate epimerase